MILNAGDTISGQEGKATAIINGEVRDMFYIKTIEATVEKNKQEVRTFGHRGVQHKATGWSGSGSMNMYYVTSDYVKLMVDYVKTGVDTYFTITFENNDPTSTIGSQIVTLSHVNINSAVVIKGDVENSVLDCDVEFTFEDIDLVQPFGEPQL